MTTIVSYIKHWDNDTKGSIQFTDLLIPQAVAKAELELVGEAYDEGIDPMTPSADLFTITKTESVEGTNWTGVPKAAF